VYLEVYLGGIPPICLPGTMVGIPPTIPRVYYVGIHLPTMPGTTPPWVYHLLLAYPVYRSSCPSSDPSAGERALGSKEGILLGRGLSPS